MKKLFTVLMVVLVFILVSCDSGTKKDTDKDLGTADKDVNTDQEVADDDSLQITDHDSSVTDHDSPVTDHEEDTDHDSLFTDDDSLFTDKDSEEPDDEFIPEEYTVDGFVQKGPFIKDSEIQITELDNNFEMIPSTSFTTKTIDDIGNFNIKRKFSSRYIEIKASGFYYDEVAGAVSSTQITNYVFVDLKANNSKISINILTTLARKRIQYLMKHGKNFNEARSQSETEILEIFGIFGETAANFQDMDILKSGNSNAMLLAISARLQGDRTPGELSVLTAGIIYEIEETGKLTNDALKTSISEGGIYIADKLTNIRNNLDTYFGGKTTVEVPNFEDYCDDNGNGIINKWDFDLDFGVVENAERNIVFIPGEKTVKVNPATTAVAKTTFGKIVINGTDTELSESPISDGDKLSVRVVSSNEFNTTVTAVVTVEFTVNEGNVDDWTVSGSYSVTTGECDYDDIQIADNVCGDGSGTSEQKCIEGIWINQGDCTRVFNCSPKPEENNTWNSVNKYTQTWNGSEWSPADSTTTHNVTASTTSCRFKCNTNYTWNGSACVGSTRTHNCAAKPDGSVWNTVSKYTQTWIGSTWTPADSTTTYNTTASTTSCRYKCDTGFTWNGSKCIFDCINSGGKCWSTRVSGNWASVSTYCQNIGGRLPTISELRTLILGCPATQTGGSCGVTDSCLESSCRNGTCGGCSGGYSALGDNANMWSSSSPAGNTTNAWTVGFNFWTIIDYNPKTSTAYSARCIR